MMLLFLVIAASQLAAAPAAPDRMDLFESGAGGYTAYRIPGLVATSKGSLLAYAEARKSARGDWGPIDIVLRRSADRGKTWSAMAVIAKVDGPHRKNPVALAQNLASPDDVTYNNPVAIPDRNGIVHFVFCQEYARAFYMRSADDGVTWSKPLEITAVFDGYRPQYNWKVIATGPGHGIQLVNGRLVIPIWMSLGTGGHAHRPSVNATIYSADHGKTWRRGDIAVPDTPDTVFPNETAAVQLSSGRVLLNVRSESKAHRKILVSSKDGATGWSKPEFHDQLLEPICMAGMVAVPGRKAILFSNPNNVDRLDGKAEPGRPRDRRNLTVQLSEDDGKTWTASRALEPGWSGYSDLAAFKDGTVFCLYERGESGAPQFRTAALTLARFPLEWLREK